MTKYFRVFNNARHSAGTRSLDLRKWPKESRGKRIGIRVMMLLKSGVRPSVFAAVRFSSCARYPVSVLSEFGMS